MSATNSVESTVPVATISKLLSQSGGDSVRLRKSLVKRLKAGDEKAKGYLIQLDVHEETEAQMLEEFARNVAQKEAEEQASIKAKYALRYPKINI